MRNSARAKLGYYPLPVSEGARLRNLLLFPPEGASVLDPCVGTGAALLRLTEGANVHRLGVELDADRACQANESGIETIYGNLFGAHAKAESLSFLYVNPPYDSEIGSFDNRRMEFLFLEHTYHWLVPGGVLLMVVQHKQLESCISLLAAHFGWFRVARLTDPESERFDQVALLAVRKKITAAAHENNRRALVEAIWRKPLPALTGNEPAYQVPPSAPAKLVYRGLPLDQLEDAVRQSAAWRKVASCLLSKEEVSVGRPITPLHAGHVGLLCTAGLLNGVFGEGDDRHIARWRTVKYLTTYTEKEEGYTEVHKQERFSNEVALLYENGRTLVLTDKAKGEEDAERSPEIRAA
jgi:SAM-dependent methyltransferase